MDNQRSRLVINLAKYLQDAVATQLEPASDPQERWQLVADQVDLMIAAALLKQVRSRGGRLA